MKILLAQPPSRHRERESIVVPPLGLSYIAAVLEKDGHGVEILDAFALRQSWSEFENSIRKAHADIVGLGGMTPVIDNTYRAAKICRKYCEYLVVGGPHVTVFAKDVFEQIPEADFAVYGEGENTFLELVRTIDHSGDFSKIAGLATKEGVNPPRELVSDLDSLPFPARHLLPNHLYEYIFSRNRRMTTMFTSRGCPYQCIFCDKSVFGSKYRKRSAENVVQEISLIKDMYEDVSIVFYDDLFTLDKKRVIRICQGILERGLRIDWKCEGRVDVVDDELLGWMRRAGCSMIAYGVESGNQKGIDYLNKNITLDQARSAFRMTQKAGIMTTAYFVLGIPVETYQDEMGTIEFARRLKPNYAQFSILSPFPGTKLYDDAIKEETYREIDAQNPVDKDLKRPVVISANWNEENLKRIVLEAHRGFYLRPTYILRTGLSVIGKVNFLKAFRMGVKIFRWSAERRGKNAC
jgi:radical SAM superfamily enzyme YgiQ (UPF0313 family)